jgi:hypothetical protein
MGSYFSFERMITPGFVKVVYFLGFIALTAAGVALAVWAGMQLNDAIISRSLGWRYVAYGVALVLVGNLVWRVFCELWVVLFGIHDEMVSVRHGLNLYGLRTTEEPIEQEEIVEREEIVRPREVVVQERRTAPRHAGVLGLS